MEKTGHTSDPWQAPLSAVRYRPAHDSPAPPPPPAGSYTCPPQPLPEPSCSLPGSCPVAARSLVLIVAGIQPLGLYLQSQQQPIRRLASLAPLMVPSQHNSDALDIFFELSLVLREVVRAIRMHCGVRRSLMRREEEAMPVAARQSINTSPAAQKSDRPEQRKKNSSTFEERSDLTIVDGEHGTALIQSSTGWPAAIL